MRHYPTECPNCESGLEPYILYDARGIECGWVCDECVEERKREYRPDIFTDSQYPCDEEIEDGTSDDWLMEQYDDASYLDEYDDYHEC